MLDHDKTSMKKNATKSLISYKHFKKNSKTVYIAVHGFWYIQFKIKKIFKTKIYLFHKSY